MKLVAVTLKYLMEGERDDSARERERKGEKVRRIYKAIN